MDIREKISSVLADAMAPAVLCSFGKDSLLLLHLVREQRRGIPVIWFKYGLTREQQEFGRQIIREWDLEAWDWWPADSYLVPNDDGLSLVHEHSFGGAGFPVIADLEDGPSCIFDLPQERPLGLRQCAMFDKVFLGYKNTDYHSSLGGSGFCPEDGWTLGQTQFYAPLREMNDEQVWQALRDAGLPKPPENGIVQRCTNCLCAGQGPAYCPKVRGFVPRVKWDANACLRGFRQRFGFKETAHATT